MLSAVSDGRASLHPRPAERQLSCRLAGTPKALQQPPISPCAMTMVVVAECTAVLLCHPTQTEKTSAEHRRPRGGSRHEHDRRRDDLTQPLIWSGRWPFLRCRPTAQDKHQRHRQEAKSESEGAGQTPGGGGQKRERATKAGFLHSVCIYIYTHSSNRRRGLPNMKLWQARGREVDPEATLP